MDGSSPWVCLTCGGNFAPAAVPPAACPLCEDERQWVPASGQRWATMAQLAESGHHSSISEQEPGLTAVAVEPSLAIGHRGLLVRTPEGNLLWDPPGFIDDGAIEAVRALGGLRAVSSSHPHMYGAAVEWSHAFDVPIALAAADDAWLMRPDKAVRRWSGTDEVLPGVTLVQCGGHFPGSTVCHWAAGAEGRGAILTGDTLFVTPGADRDAFLWSAPNHLPLPEREVRRVVDALAGFEFDRIYGGWSAPVLRAGAHAAVGRGAERYIAFLRGDALDAEGNATA